MHICFYIVVKAYFLAGKGGKILVDIFVFYTAPEGKSTNENIAEVNTSGSKETSVIYNPNKHTTDCEQRS